MNTTKNGMRALVVSAAAGALVLGSAAGVATAKPATPKAPKQEYMQLRMVDVHNGFLNVNEAAAHRDLKVKALVRDTVKASDPAEVSVVLAHYSAKGTPANPALIPDVTIPLALKSKAGKKSQMYGAVVKTDALAAALRAVLPEGATTYVCLKDATLVAPGVTIKAPANQVAKKIKRGRDCFRVVNVKPELTKSTSDDVK